MSRLTEMAATSHTLSVAALEEASRVGQRTADIDHLLLALVVSAQDAGQVLRSLGITLASAREAVAEQHADQLASLGITAPAPEPGRITFHETGGQEWGERPLEVIRRSADGDRRGDAAAVLRELLDEPSGFIDQVLRRLGTTPDAVRARLDEVERHPTLPPADAGSPLSGSAQGFAAAPVEAVWALLADPSRMPEWDPATGAVEDAPTSAAIGSTWTGRLHTRRADGRPLRVKPERRRTRIEVVDVEEHQLIGWRLTWPDAPKTNARRIRIALEPAAGGTQLRIDLAWEPDAHRRPSPLAVVVRWLVRPLTRLAIWMQTTQIAAAISRAFR
ncbi:SRPBCC family protein [Microbacterium sp. gxy059]|uniref:SRPBCC family protein n=1 Tax=Microbacterium sp. gxy059 TaxID=2957199 RepID=UPI003D978CBB